MSTRNCPRKQAGNKSESLATEERFPAFFGNKDKKCKDCE